MSRFGTIPGKVYVGNLSNCGNVREIEDAFTRFGSVKNVWVARQPPGFAFVEFDEPRDAEDAVHSLHSTYICGRRVDVEHATGEKQRNRSGGGGGGGGGGGRYQQRRSYNDDKCYECGARGHFARDCSYNQRRRQRSRSRSRDRYNSYSSRRYRSPSHSRSRSRSRSRSYHSPLRN